jgi:hypothetical protein
MEWRPPLMLLTIIKCFGHLIVAVLNNRVQVPGRQARDRVRRAFSLYKGASTQTLILARNDPGITSAGRGVITDPGFSAECFCV